MCGGVYEQTAGDGRCLIGYTPFTLMRFEYGCTRFSGIRFSASFSRSRDQFLYVDGMLTVRSRRLGGRRFLRFGAFLIAERRPRSNVIRSTRMTYGNHGVIMTLLYTRMAAVSSRIHAMYSRIYTVGSRIFTDIRGGFANIRVLYTGFAEALRLLRYRRFSYGV